MPAFREMPIEKSKAIVNWMLQQDLLWDEAGILGIGRKGEATYGRQHFMELLSAFLSPPLFRVLHGRQELGFVDELTFFGKQEGSRVLLLGGRAWRVTHVDWSRKVACAEGTEERGRTRWKGEGPGLGFRLCQAIKGVLTGIETREWWSNRATEKIEQLRTDFLWLAAEGTTPLVTSGGEAAWWTFAGFGANASLAPALSDALHCRVAPDSFALSIERRIQADAVREAIDSLRTVDSELLVPNVDDGAIQGLKFTDCLPREIALGMLERRLRDRTGTMHSLKEPTRIIA